MPNGHDDIHVLASDPTSPASRILVGNDGGLYEWERTVSGWNLNGRNGSLRGVWRLSPSINPA